MDLRKKVLLHKKIQNTIAVSLRAMALDYFQEIFLTSESGMSKINDSRTTIYYTLPFSKVP